MTARHRSAAFVAVFTALTVLSRANAQAPCGDFDECTLNPMCQANGTCAGTPQPDNTTCNDENECTTNDRCQSGACRGTPDQAKIGQPCSFGFSHPCILSATCTAVEGGAFCAPSIKQCPDVDGNECTIEACDFSSMTATCTTVPKLCDTACATAACRSTDGACINPTPRTNGFPCSDGNTCTSPDSCQGGMCVAGGSVPTSTPGSPTRTPTITRTPTRTSTGGAVILTATPTGGSSACPGDCDGDGMVSSAEMTKIRQTILRCGPCPGGGLGGVANGCAAVAGGCPAADFNADGCLRGGDLTRAANSVIQSCGGSSVSRRAVGLLQSTTSVFLALPRVVGAFLGPAASIAGGGGGAQTVFDLPFTCPTSGGGSLKCEQSFFPSLTPPVYTATLNACKATTAAGRTVTMNGVVVAMGQAGDFCGALPSPLQVSTDNLVLEEAAAAGSLTASFTDFAAVVNLSGDHEECTYDNIGLQLEGNVLVVTKNTGGTTLTSTQVSFGEGSMIEIFVAEYASGCTPVQYAMEVNGDIAFATGGPSVAVTFESYLLTNDATGGDNQIEIDGSVESACLGATVVYGTTETMIIPAAAPCPVSGRIRIEEDAAVYSPGSVGLDLEDDDSIDEAFITCLDPALYVCL